MTKAEINNCKNTLFLGRLAEFKYFDMDDAILNALTKLKKL